MTRGRRPHSILECQQKLREIRLKYFGIRRVHNELDRDDRIPLLTYCQARGTQNCTHCFRNASTSRCYDILHACAHSNLKYQLSGAIQKI